MGDWDDEPELAGYVPNEGVPRRRRRLLVVRVVVVLGILCLVLPQVVTMVSVATTTANEACAAWVRYEAPDATGSSASFELFGDGGLGWQCYSVGSFGGGKRVASLGLIPVSPTLSRVPAPVTEN
ncbi:MAG TPA: hypothetical protein VGC18_13240 [Lacisediminihabitans sp.]|uniref:hypothetical protein n=1 Tax=Lacisediminihabitans sp. TaxID=2787631 RepID=UPI002EDB183D